VLLAGKSAGDTALSHLSADRPRLTITRRSSGRSAASTAPTSRTERPVWLVLAEPLPARVFLDCGIASGLRDHFGDRLQPVFLVYMRREFDRWVAELGGSNVLFANELVPETVPRFEALLRRGDRWLDHRIGYYPLAIRLNYRHGFHLERMRPGHANALLDSARIGPLPRWSVIERVMQRWYFSSHRHVPHALLERLREERPAIVLSNLQMEKVAPFFVAARRLSLPLVGYVASWDHPVGKGVISPHFDRYIVQNEVMRADLARYHGIDPGRVVVTGWPQSDVFHAERPRAAYDAIARTYGLNPTAPIVLVMGNTPANAPYEGRFVERLVAWRHSTKSAPQLLFRPHPVDRYEWPQRFAAALGVEGIAVQEPSYTDMDVLATLLRHADCVVANAGTILLDALVNDRPAVCVLYDEGAPPGESWAAKNVIGEHYRELVGSGAFLRAERFEEVVAGIERSLAAPDEFAAERRRVVRAVVGDVDGRAAERIVKAIAEAVDREANDEASERSRLAGEA
jgi:CDP-Glycerol:Poly(glycerophosphate) glycerophosphotransferase